MLFFETAVSEMAVSNAKVTFRGSMHIVFHLQFNLPSSSFFLPMSVFVATGLYFCSRIDNNSILLRYECRKKEGVESLKNEI